ncbi:hypothetical protein Q0M94_25665 (plasmid) [Deinococcus radiomollis]|uniref:RCC1 domain-containing protein n=1 Tax=Deinococcus radiomollis TaxID=468916 RepID=UPI0038917919
MTLRPPVFQLLLPALLLAACGQQGVSTTQPALSTPVQASLPGVYQISFQNVGSPNFSASVPSALQTQGLVATPEAFIFDHVSSSTFVVKATGIRHVQATFQVTNNTGLTLNSLKFVPVVPTNKSSVFSGVTYFDGSDASSKAGSLTTVQGQNFDLTTRQATVDGSASPYLTGLDVSGVDTSGRGVSSIKNYGWQAAATLAPGAAATVTFAVDLPADVANPRNDPFNFSLNVTSVQQGTTLTSAVQQYNRATKSYGNYSQFPTSSGASLPAYYDLKNVDRTGASVASVLCSFDGAVISNISTASFPNRYRVSVTSLGNHTVQAYAGTSCPATAGTPLLSQTVVGVAPPKVSLAGGSDHSLALNTDGTVRGWGYNFDGELGDGTYTSSSTPVTASGLSGVVGLAGGDAHTLALKADGTVNSWGANGSGQLGNSTVAYYSNTPITVTGLTGVVSIASGRDHSLALKSDGTVRSWGYNAQGQLGNGTTASSSTPVTVSNLTDVVSLAGGGAHSLALRADGTVRSWGYNGSGQLGNGTTTQSTTPVTVSGLTDVVGLASGSSHSLALKSDGTVRSWGDNTYGQLGNGTSNSSNTPVPVTGLTGVVGIASGSNHSLALKSDGAARSWGSNTYGQLGDGTINDSSTPMTVPGLTDAVGLAGGGNHSLALKSDGTVRTWGRNSYGQLGDGTTTDSSTPVNTLISGVAQPTP